MTETWLGCCADCAVDLTLANCGFDASRVDGVGCYCRTCKARRGRESRQRTLARVGPDVVAETQRRRERADPLKYRARMALRSAVRSGRLSVPEACEQCATVGVTLAGHHANGYEPEHWLDVRWLCHRCHSLEHTTPLADRVLCASYIALSSSPAFAVEDGQ